MPLVADPGSLDRADLDKANQTWSDLLREHFATDAPDEFARFDTLFAEQPSEFLGEQIATHLENLGYLSAIDAAGMTAESVWRPAFEIWQADQRAADRTNEPAVTVNLGEENLAQMSDEERAIRLLKAQCSFEGEIMIRHPTATPPDALAARIARHRLRSFGFLTADADLDAVDEVAQELSRPSFIATEFVNLLGDVPELTSRFVQTQHQRVFVFAKTAEATEQRFAMFRIKRRRKTGLGQATFRSAAARKRHGSAGGMITRKDDHRAELRATIDPGLEEASSSSPERPPAALNRFALFLLQVRLWMFGYYAGALDGRWGVMTAKALGRFIEEHESGGAEKQALADWQKWLWGNSETCVIDLCYLFSYMVARLDEAAEITARDEIDGLADAALRSDENDADAQARISAAESDLTNKLIVAHQKRRERQAEDRGAVAAAGESSGGRRRRYFGWRAVFGLFGRALRWIGRSIRKALSWLKENIQRLLHYATTLVNYIREKARRAVRLVALGIQRIRTWITGDLVVTVRGDAVVLTKSYLDFDTVHLASASPNAEVIDDHLVRLDCLTAGFGFLIEIGFALWSVLTALEFAMVNWLLVAWRAYKAVRRALDYIDDNAALLDRLEPAVI